MHITCYYTISYESAFLLEFGGTLIYPTRITIKHLILMDTIKRNVSITEVDSLTDTLIAVRAKLV